ncbi:hypothetical protein CPHO_08260 [Corynebacterium phocae]|uniref:N-acetylmuramoyl-L-alanine amidase n=1 Tax=Corynebacterium phocae TaxID=161895 RepID=A0A1L7D416_9CORY|nr:peptidoglycan recognition family protein [Corynebacterium phocae]APT92879.1 hypothetical protein CPHO_08260 [Corynebacterium phocae]KAA8723201.1 N-acetylmuramoyl-L-alanine amidase [Corynebacterium phocae]
MKNWHKLEPDRVRLLTRHFTPGRTAKIEFVTIHHMAMVGGLDECWRVWQQRQASAHYCVANSREIGQAVWDKDTAWSNANAYSNARSISIEHSNCGGPAQDWPISDDVLDEGAHLVAAICHYYKLGRPVSGMNVRFHSIESGGTTSCPYHLRPGGKYHDHYMNRAQYWYDQMAREKEGTPMIERIRSLINPKKAFSQPELLAIIDATNWENNQLLKSLAKKVGIDPDTYLRDAVAKDREGK